MRTFLSFETAREIVLGSARRTETEHVPLGTSLGRTLAADVVSAEDIPPFDNSAMDGFAVRASDLSAVPRHLRLVGDVPAGIPLAYAIRPGECARIMTGAPVPEGADTVVPVEQVDEEGDQIQFAKTPDAGDHIRRSGEDIRKGSCAVASGALITPPVIGMLATLGLVSVPSARPPSLAIVSTGDEIVPPEETPGPGQIRNSNGPALEAQALTAGAVVSGRVHVPDDRAALRRTIDSLRGCDVIVLSGGVSMGKYDYVRTELADMGCIWAFWKVRQRPGKPLLFGKLGSTLVLGLPGNPVSSAICFEVYVRPLLATMLGRKKPLRALESARLGSDMKKVKGLRYFSRGILAVPEHGEGTQEALPLPQDAQTGYAARPVHYGPVVMDTGPQGSNIYSSMVSAECIIHMPETMENPPAGTEVLIERLTW